MNRSISMQGRMWLVAGVATLAAWSMPAMGQSDNPWMSAGGGAFTNDANWGFFGPPPAADGALFDLDAAFKVDGFGAGTENLRAIVGASAAGDGIDVTFDLGEHTWTLTSTENAAGGLPVVLGTPALAVGDGEGYARMNLTNGTISAAGVAIGTGNTEGSTSILRVTGENALLQATDTTQRAGGEYSLWVGVRSSAELRIENGGQVETKGLYLGFLSNTPGGQADGTVRSVVITGAGSALTNDGANVWIHNAGSGDSLTVSDGGQLTSKRLIRIESSGFTINIDNGTVTVDGAGGADNRTFMQYGVSSVANVSNGGRLEAETLRVFRNHVPWEAPPTFNVLAGGSIDISGQARIGEDWSALQTVPYAGVLVVSDATSVANVGALRIAARVDGGADRYTRGTVNVLNGGVVNVTNDLTVSETPHGTYTNEAYVSVLGAGSKVAIGGSAYLGGTATAAAGDAYVTIGNGGVLEVDNLLRVYGTAELMLDSEGAMNTMVQSATLDLQADSLLKATLYGVQRTAGVGAGGNALMLTTGNATIASGAELQITLDGDYEAVLGDVFTLLQVNGTLTGAFKDLPENTIVFSGLGAENDLDMRINYVTNNDSITLTVIPEPGVASLLFACFAGLIALRRRRG